jgi:hypothetical protein
MPEIKLTYLTQNNVNSHSPLKKNCKACSAQLQMKEGNLKRVIIHSCEIPKALQSNQTREELKYENSQKLR